MPYLTPEERSKRERIRKEFTTRLNETMNRRGISQARLVELTGLPQANLSAMMNGRIGASTTRIVALARALNVDPHYLMPVLPPNDGNEQAKAGDPSWGWGALARLRERVKETATIELVEMLEELVPLRLAGLAKDDEFWARWLEIARNEIEIRNRKRAQAEGATSPGAGGA